MKQTFPPIFGPYHQRTELLAALLVHGPVRAADLDRAFHFKVARSVQTAKSNAARLIAASSEISRNRGRIVGINHNLGSLRQPMLDLVRRVLERCPLREIVSDIRPEEVEFFFASEHPPVDVEALFGSHLRTRMFVALQALDGEETVGRLQRAVLRGPKNNALHEIQSWANDYGLLRVAHGTVYFNDDLWWMPEFRALLEAMTPLMPEIAEHPRTLREKRKKSKKGTAHSYGQEFRLFGSRVNQAILAFLAANGPAGTTEIMAAAACDPWAMRPLIKIGLLAVIAKRSGKFGDLYSLNAAHPLYAEIRALLRSEAVRNQTWEYRPPELKEGYTDGTDLRLEHGDTVQARFLPYQIFGVDRKKVTMDVLAMLVHTPFAESDPASLRRMASRRKYEGVKDATERLWKMGILRRRDWKGMWLYALDEQWPAYSELRALLLAAGRVWTEYAEGGAAERELFDDFRAAREWDRAESTARARRALP